MWTNPELDWISLALLCFAGYGLIWVTQQQDLVKIKNASLSLRGPVDPECLNIGSVKEIDDETDLNAPYCASTLLKNTFTAVNTAFYYIKYQFLLQGVPRFYFFFTNIQWGDCSSEEGAKEIQGAESHKEA